MRCPNCNERLEGNEAFCPNCGCRIEEAQEEFRQEIYDDEQEGKKKPKTSLVIAVVVIAAIVIGGAMGIFGFNLLDDKDGKQSEQQVEEESDENKETADADASDEKKDDVDKGDADKDDAAPEEVDEPEEDIPITLSMISNPASLNDYYKLSVADASATSVVDQKGHNNSAAMVLDGKKETSWQEGVDGVGIDEKLLFRFSQESKMRYISFKLGNWRTDDYHWQNNRPKTLEIQTDECTQMITFPDNKQEYWVEFSDECSTDDISFTIKDVYRGTSNKWNDTCIAEITMYGTTE